MGGWGGGVKKNETTYSEFNLLTMIFSRLIYSKINEKNRSRVKELEAKILELKKKQVSTVFSWDVNFCSL